MSFSLEEYLNELRPLINVDCGTYTLDGIDFIAEQFENKFLQLAGWQVKRIDCDRAGVGLEIRNKPESELIDVMLIGHMDTVFPPGTAAQRPMTLDSQKAYGPGVSDMKSGLLNIVYAIRKLSQSALDKLSICICMNPDEETGSLYSHQWIQNIAKKARYVLVAEAARADGSLVKARKGMARYKIEFSGIAAHAGNEPEKGRSAITEMAHWILAINQMTNLSSGTTLNVGVVSGGTGANIVPDQAQAIVDVRFWNNQEYDDINHQLISMIEQPYLNGVKISLHREAYKPAMIPSDETQSLMSIVEQVGSEIGLDIHWQAVGGGSDANVTAILGIPTLDGFGPIGAGFHSEEEYLLLDSIESRIKLLINLLERLAR